MSAATTTYLRRIGHRLEVANVADLLGQARFRLHREEYQGWGTALRLRDLGLGLGDGQQGIFHLVLEMSCRVRLLSHVPRRWHTYSYVSRAFTSRYSPTQMRRPSNIESPGTACFFTKTTKLCPFTLPAKMRPPRSESSPERFHINTRCFVGVNSSRVCV